MLPYFEDTAKQPITVKLPFSGLYGYSLYLAGKWGSGHPIVWRYARPEYFFGADTISVPFFLLYHVPVALFYTHGMFMRLLL